MERFRNWLHWVGWQRFTFIVAAAPVVGFVAWWMVRLPTPPIESLIPVAPTHVAGSPGAPSSPERAKTPDWLSPLGTTAPARVAVHVVGAVNAPGVYHLESGARADDALRAAGGANANADLRRVNLAAAVHDGAQLYIPRVGERMPADLPVSSAGSAPNGAAGNVGAAGNSATAGSSTAGNAASTSTLPLIIDLNLATAADLDRLPGVGPSTAKAIIDHRTRNGPFASIDDLLKVKGIGPAKLAEIRPWVRV
ncbi:MAG: ComEA family DNA-binding protein [Ilumatobacteraceae bacterium]